MVSQDTLKQMQLSDRKNTSPLLNFNLTIGKKEFDPKCEDSKRPREIILWDAKAEAAEKIEPHFLNLTLKNMQGHPQGIATAVVIKIKLSFPMCEAKDQLDTEILEISFSFMDPDEKYTQSIIRISGLPTLIVEVESISYKDMFGQQYVIGYGYGFLEMKEDYKYERLFTTISGQTPDEPFTTLK